MISIRDNEKAGNAMNTLEAHSLSGTLMRRVNRSALILVAATVLFPSLLAAQPSKFVKQDSTLYIPCVDVHRGGSSVGAYQAIMVLDKGLMTLSEAERISITEDCSGIFDQDTGLYTDVVRYGDNLFDASLQWEMDRSFSVSRFEFKKRGRSSLWVVRNGENLIYLAGTVHFLREGDFPLPEIYEEAYGKSDFIVTETDPDESADEDMRREFIRVTTNPDGPYLDETLSQETYDKLSQRLKDADIDLSRLHHVKPFWILQLLRPATVSEIEYGEGVDDHFVSRAREDGKANDGLETIIEQTLALNNVYDAVPAEELVSDALDSRSEDVRDVWDAINVAWRDGLVEWMNQWLIEPGKQFSPRSHEYLLKRRNEAWLPKVVDYLETPEVEMILVGVAHLVGDDSLIRLLLDLGYEVEFYE